MLHLVCTVMTVHIFFTYPETARRTLEEIDLLFDSDIPPWRSAKAQVGALEERAEKIERNGSVEADFKEKDGDVKQEVV